MIYSLPVTVSGGSGGDSLYGGGLDDVLIGDAGQDSLAGGAGNDVLDGGLGPDTLSGGDLVGYPATNGFDLVDYSDRAAAVTVTLDGRTNDGEAGEGDNVAANVDDVAGGSGPDVIVGSDLGNELYGEDGNDTIDGGAGADLLAGGGGDDRSMLAMASPTTYVAAPETTPRWSTRAMQSRLTARPVERPAVAVAPPPAAIDRIRPEISMTLPKRPSLRSIRARGLRVRVVTSEPCTIKGELQVSRVIARWLQSRDSRRIAHGRHRPRHRHASPRRRPVDHLDADDEGTQGIAWSTRGTGHGPVTARDAAGNTRTVTASRKARRP